MRMFLSMCTPCDTGECALVGANARFVCVMCVGVSFDRFRFFPCVYV